jgi:hypothetical protein
LASSGQLTLSLSSLSSRRRRYHFNPQEMDLQSLAEFLEDADDDEGDGEQETVAV